jgi:hypothetical protein
MDEQIEGEDEVFEEDEHIASQEDVTGQTGQSTPSEPTDDTMDTAVEVLESLPNKNLLSRIESNVASLGQESPGNLGPASLSHQNFPEQLEPYPQDIPHEEIQSGSLSDSILRPENELKEDDEVADFSITARRGSATHASPLRLDNPPKPISRSTLLGRGETSKLNRELKNLGTYNKPGLKEGQVDTPRLRIQERKDYEGEKGSSESMQDEDE